MLKHGRVASLSRIRMRPITQRGNAVALKLIVPVLTAFITMQSPPARSPFPSPLCLSPAIACGLIAAGPRRLPRLQCLAPRSPPPIMQSRPPNRTLRYVTSLVSISFHRPIPPSPPALRRTYRRTAHRQKRAVTWCECPTIAGHLILFPPATLLPPPPPHARAHACVSAAGRMCARGPWHPAPAAPALAAPSGAMPWPHAAPPSQR